jgi:hypothetical protein
MVFFELEKRNNESILGMFKISLVDKPELK